MYRAGISQRRRCENIYFELALSGKYSSMVDSDQILSVAI